ncbi:MAG: hypothetical protein GY953_04435 [bacterium]|nr:hypothetical protein [bacterium]
MEKQRIGSFTAYLEEKQRLQRSRQPASKVSAINLLPILAAAEGKELPVSELMSRSGLGFGDFSKAYVSLETAGLIELDSGSGEEVIRLTAKGEEIAAVAQAD